MLFQLISIQLIETWIIYNANFYENSTYLNGHPWSTQQVRGGRVIPIVQRSVKREGYVKESEYVRNLTIALFIFRFYSFNLQKQFQSFTRRRKFGKLIHYFFFTKNHNFNPQSNVLRSLNYCLSTFLHKCVDSTCLRISSLFMFIWKNNKEDI